MRGRAACWFAGCPPTKCPAGEIMVSNGKDKSSCKCKGECSMQTLHVITGQGYPPVVLDLLHTWCGLAYATSELMPWWFIAAMPLCGGATESTATAAATTAPT